MALPIKRRSEITRACTAGILFSAAVLLITPAGSRRYTTVAFLTAVSAMILLFRPEVANSFHTLSVYAANWEFSGFVFRLLRSLTGSGRIAREVIGNNVFQLFQICLYVLTAAYKKAV